MLKRVVTALILVAFVVLMLYFGASNYIFLDMLILAFSFVGTYEIYHSFRKGGYNINCVPLILVSIAIYPLWYFFGLRGLTIIFSVVTLLSLAIFTFKQDMTINDLAATLFAVIYPFGLISLAFSLSRDYNCGGVFAISFAVFLPVFADSFAYLVGSAFGKRKLCPSISPKKTIAGAIGGEIGSIICAVVFFLVFDYYKVIRAGYTSFTDNVGISIAVFIALGIAGGVIAEIGDLAASRIKRSLNIKDFGNVFPGHGGVLDRLDSILFTLVMLYIVYGFIY